MNKRFLVATAVVLGGCGPQGTGAQHPFFDTLNYISENGMPTLADLLPALPQQFSFIEGVDTDGSGLPGLPSSLSDSGLSGGTSSFNKLVGEAQTLSAQGFSEARRAEALVHNLIGPVFDVVGKSDVFAQIAGTASAESDATETSPAFHMQSGEAVGSGGVTNVFQELFNNFSFAIALEEVAGMPSHLVLSAVPGGESISIAGLWPGMGDGLETGFHVDLKIISPNEFDLTFSLAPQLLGGLVPSWNTTECESDLWQVRLSATEGTRAARIASLECPDTRNAISSLAVGVTGGTMTINGGFAQSFDGDANTLRGWLGARQGFVMQATSDTSFDRIAAAAAVIKEDDFAAPTQETIDQFGVGRLVNSYVQAKYWLPKRAKAKEGISFSDYDNYDNFAYWMCEVSSIKNAIKSSVAAVSTLCAGKEVSIDNMLDSLGALKAEINDVPLVGDDVKATINGLIDVLTIRNAIFITSGGDLAYEEAPDADFAALNEARSASGVEAVADLSWQEGVAAQLPNTARAELPPSAFQSISGALGSFLQNGCENLVGNAADKAQKQTDASQFCIF